MPIRDDRPTSPGRRLSSQQTFSELTRRHAERPLVAPLKRTGGRNNRGTISVRHRGGGAKRSYRLIDFKRDKHGVPGRVATIEYDPNRNARIALIHYLDGDKRYIIAPLGLAVGATVEAGPQAEIKPGNSLRMGSMPTGISVHNLELYPGRGGQLARGAGTAARLLAKEGSWVLVRLPSGEVRRINGDCAATVGQVGNPEYKNISWGKAGRSRHLGHRPSVRGSAMNPRDHPHGGGEGRSPIGRPGPVTPWGKPTLGYRTRRNRSTDRFIVRRRTK